MLVTILLPVMCLAKLECVLRFSTHLTKHNRPVAGHANLLVRFPEMPVLFNQFAALPAWDLSIGSGPSGIVKRTQPAYSGPLSAFLAFLRFPEAFQTHLFSALRNVSFWDVLAALKTRCSVFCRVPESLVMIRAHSPSDGNFIAKFAGLLWIMNLFVMSMILTKLKIVWVVIVNHPVTMVNNLRWLKKASNLLFHNEPMFKHISIGVTMRMLRAANQKIALLIAVFPAFPVWVRCAFHGCESEYGRRDFNYNTKLLFICR